MNVFTPACLNMHHFDQYASMRATDKKCE